MGQKNIGEGWGKPSGPSHPAGGLHKRARNLRTRKTESSEAHNLHRSREGPSQVLVCKKRRRQSD